MTALLNTTNPEHLLYSYEQIHFEVLGGIKLDTLNSMRATLKVKFFTNDQRHTLDLYNNNALQRFLKTSAEHLELGLPYMQKATASLINELETYRLKEQERLKQNIIKPKILTEQETKEALTLLKTKNLLLKTNELLGKSGIVGEELNRLIMYLIFTTRKLSNPLHIISLAASGTGKSYLQEKVAQCIPEEDKKEITALSPNSFYYQGQTDLKHKLILLEDLTGAESSLFPIRELQSKKYIIKEVSHKNTKGETVTITKKVEGPVCIGACTTSENLYEDNANRSFLIYLDDSKEQDERIMSYQRKLHADKINKQEENAAKNLLQNVQRLLKPVKIINPFAEYLHIPNDVFKKRRTNAHYLQFIEAITFFKQYQKQEQVNETTGELYINTDLEDIKEANELMKHILLRKSDELSGACRQYFEHLKQWLVQDNKQTFTNQEARMALKENHSNQKRYMLQLQQGFYLRRVEENKSKTHTYEILSAEDYTLLKNSITNVLDSILKDLKQNKQTSERTLSELALSAAERKGTVQEFKPVQKQDELIKPNKINTSKPSSVKTKEVVHPQQKQFIHTTQQVYYELLTLSYPQLEVAFLLEDACKHTGRKTAAITKYVNALVEQHLLTKTKKGLYNYYNIVASLPIKNSTLNTHN